MGRRAATGEVRQNKPPKKGTRLREPPLPPQRGGFGRKVQYYNNWHMLSRCRPAKYFPAITIVPAVELMTSMDLKMKKTMKKTMKMKILIIVHR